MKIKETLVADLKATLEETANTMADRVILESLAKNGSVSLEEAEFYNSLVHRVITEAAEEFVPEALDLSALEEAQEFAAAQEEAQNAEPMILTAEDGTVYSYNAVTGELTPVEGTEADEGFEGQEGADEAQEDLEDLESDEAGLGEGLKESSEVQTETEVIEESEVSPADVVETEVEGGVETDETVEAAPEELTESQLIVSNLIKSLGA